MIKIHLQLGEHRTRSLSWKSKEEREYHWYSGLNPHGRSMSAKSQGYDLSDFFYLYSHLLCISTGSWWIHINLGHFPGSFHIGLPW